MTLKELSQLYYLDKEIERDRKCLEELKENEDSNKADIVDLEAIISANITRRLHERNRLERYIEEIPDSLTRQIFTLRFIKGLTWLQVAFNIGGNNTADSVRMNCNRYIRKENKKWRG